MGNPYASVVILSRNWPLKVLECLAKQTFRDFEIILASEKGIVNAMNRALEKSKGEILIRIDDDVELPETWLGELLKPFHNPWIAGATGPTFVPKDRRKNRDSIRIWEDVWEYPPGLIKLFKQFLMDNRQLAPAAIYKCGMVSYDSNYQERFYEPKESGTMFVCNHLEGTNWAMRTELIREVGGFDHAFDGVAEWFDTDVEAKIKKQGYKLIYNPKAFLFHLLEKGEHYNERFDGFGRIKNFLRYHWRHARWRFFHPKFYIFLIVWMGYFVWKKFRS